MKLCSCVQAGTLVVFASMASVAGADMVKFNLFNHPDGGIAPPLYGMRLDGLDGDSSHDFTFDFEHPDIGTGMMLVLDTDTSEVTISGQVFGGQDGGAGYVANDFLGLWDVSFTYTANVTFSISGDDIEIEVTSEDHSGNTGTISKVGDATKVFDLQDEMGSHSYSFRFNNTDDHRFAGHAGFAGPEDFAGWGWVNHAPSPGSGDFGHITASDWLFVGRLAPDDSTIPVPTPAAFIAAVPTLGAVMLRRKR